MQPHDTGRRHSPQHQNQQTAATISLLRPPKATTREVLLTVEMSSIDEGLVDFVHDAASSHVYLVLRGGEMRINLTSLGIHVGS